MRKLLYLLVLSVLLVSCSSRKDATSYMATVKVIGKEKVVDEKEADYRIKFQAHLDNTAKEIWLTVKGENVWNLIQDDHFYHISFDRIDGVYKPIEEIHPIQVDESSFEEMMNKD